MWLSLVFFFLLFLFFPLALLFSIKRRHGQCGKTLVDPWGPPALRLLGFPCERFVQGGFFRGRLGAELSPQHLVPLPHPRTACNGACSILVDLEISAAF